MTKSNDPTDLTFDEIVSSKMTFDEIAKRFDEETAIDVGITRDPDAPEWTDDDFGNARPAVEVVPHIVAEQRRKRGRQKAPTKEKVTLRLDADIVSHFREGGRGWQTRLNETLRRSVFRS